MGFIKRQAGKKSVSKRSLLHGVGINDADYVTNPRVGGKLVMCQFYQRWASMIARCYSHKSIVNNSSYIGCTVCDEWLTFSNFKKWMKLQDWKGKHLDKDLLVQGNKIYSQSTCMFVSGRINMLTTDRANDRGRQKVGVYFDKDKGKFRAQCCDGIKQVKIGRYNTEEEAHDAYCRFKYSVIERVATGEIEPLKSALLNYKIKG